MIQYTDWYGFKVYIFNTPQKKCGIYLIVNLINNKKYVGMSMAEKGVFARTRNHSFGISPKRLKNSINKYGKENFLVIPIFYLTEKSTRKELELIESCLIKDYDSIKNGYNILECAGIGSEYGEEFRKILIESRAKPETKANFVAAWNKPGVRERRSNGIRIAHGTKEVKDRHHKGILRSMENPEYFERRSRDTINTWKNPEIREKRLNGMMLANLRPERKESRISAAIAMWNIPGYRENQKEKRTANKEKLSNMAKSIWHKRGRVIWITNDLHNKRIPENDPIPEGWRRGKVRTKIFSSHSSPDPAE